MKKLLEVLKAIWMIILAEIKVRKISRSLVQLRNIKGAGLSSLVIAARLGHESISITLNYAHLYPSKQLEIVNIIEKERI